MEKTFTLDFVIIIFEGLRDFSLANELKLGVKIVFLPNLISAIISEAGQNQPSGSIPLFHLGQGRIKRKPTSACRFRPLKAVKSGGHRQQIMWIEGNI